jgi:hypothetical protein
VKTQQAGKGLAGSDVICELWRSGVALELLLVPSRLYKWSLNPFTNPNPVYSHPYGLQYSPAFEVKIYDSKTDPSDGKSTRFSRFCSWLVFLFFSMRTGRNGRILDR